MSKWWFLPCCAWLATAQVQPTLRVDVRLVTVDVLVRNNKGPVKGLTKDDFTLQDKGKSQNIEVFAVTDTSLNSSAKADALAANVAANRMNNNGEEARAATVILFDRLNIPRSLDQAVVRTKVLAYLASLQPTDRIGVYSLGTNLTMVQDFNDDSSALIQAAKRLTSSGQPAPTDARSLEMDARLKDAFATMEQRDIRVRTAATTIALRTIARHLAGIPGRKSLVWVLSDFPLTFGEATDRRNNYTEEVSRATNVMNEANVAVYPTDPRGVSTTSTTSSGASSNSVVEGGLMPGSNAASKSGTDIGLSGMETMETIARATGGTYNHNTNDIGIDVRKVMEESAVTYTLGFYVDDKKLDGKSHDLSVKLAKKPETSGATVIHKKSYMATSAQTDQQQRGGMPELIADPLDATSVSIMAATAPNPSKPGNHAVQVRVNIADLQFERKDDKWAAAFDLGMAIETLDGKPSRVITVPNKLSLTDDQLKKGLAGGLIVDSAAPTPAQPSRLRVVVQDKASGAAGSVRIPIGPN